MSFDFKVEGSKVKRPMTMYEYCDLWQGSLCHTLQADHLGKDTILTGQAHWGQERLLALQVISKTTFDSQRKHLLYIYLSVTSKILRLFFFFMIQMHSFERATLYRGFAGSLLFFLIQFK